MVQEYGKNLNLNTVVFRGGCLTGPFHSGAKLHGFLSYLVKSILSKKKLKILFRVVPEGNKSDFPRSSGQSG